MPSTPIPSGTVPVGCVISYVGSATTLPQLASQGWLLCDGRSLPTAHYVDLFDVIGTQFGGSGSSFNLPNLQGQFLRGVDPAGAVDPDGASRALQGTQNSDPPVKIGPVVGSFQLDQVRNHQHNWDLNFSNISWDGNDISVQLATSAGSPFSGPTTNVDGGGAETRPVNVYVYYLIYTHVRST